MTSLFHMSKRFVFMPKHHLMHCLAHAYASLCIAEFDIQQLILPIAYRYTYAQLTHLAQITISLKTKSTATPQRLFFKTVTMSPPNFTLAAVTLGIPMLLLFCKVCDRS